MSGQNAEEGEITMSMSATFDLLLRGGRVICPASGIDEIKDVAIHNGKIAAVQADILPTSAREVIDVSGKLVLPGLIDTHAHVYQYVTGRFGMNADMVGVQSGVTTLVDQGGPSCMTLPGFRHFVAEPSKSRVYAFLSAYLVGGLEGHYYPQLYSPDGVDIDATVKSATANLDIVRGIKAHAEIGGFARWGIRVIEMAAEIGRRADLPVYVHFGQLWGLPESGTNGEDVDTILERVIPSAARRRRAGASVHAPSRRFRQSRGRGASRDPGGARSRTEGRCRARDYGMHFALAINKAAGMARKRMRQHVPFAQQRDHAFQDRIDVFAVGAALGQTPELAEMHIDRQVRTASDLGRHFDDANAPARETADLRMRLDAAYDIEIGVADFTVASMSTPSGL